jgi:hypothetical protein
MIPEGTRGQGFKGSRKQTLESLTPGILGPSSPTKVEKNLIFLTAKKGWAENGDCPQLQIRFLPDISTKGGQS